MLLVPEGVVLHAEADEGGEALLVYEGAVLEGGEGEGEGRGGGGLGGGLEERVREDDGLLAEGVYC